MDGFLRPCHLCTGNHLERFILGKTMDSTTQIDSLRIGRDKAGVTERKFEPCGGDPITGNQITEKRTGTDRRQLVYIADDDNPRIFFQTGQKRIGEANICLLYTSYSGGTGYIRRAAPIGHRRVPLLRAVYPPRRRREGYQKRWCPHSHIR